MATDERIEGSDLLAEVLDVHPISGQVLVQLVDPSEVPFVPLKGEYTLIATPKDKHRKLLVPGR